MDKRERRKGRTRIYLTLHIKLYMTLPHVLIYILYTCKKIEALGTINVIAILFFYVTLHHTPIHAHTRYEGTGPKGKRVLPRIKLYDKNQLFEFVVKGQGHSKLMFVLDTPPCIVHTYAKIEVTGLKDKLVLQWKMEKRCLYTDDILKPVYPQRILRV